MVPLILLLLPQVVAQQQEMGTPTAHQQQHLLLVGQQLGVAVAAAVLPVALPCSLRVAL
jgi:hypothetical protein